MTKLEYPCGCVFERIYYFDKDIKTENWVPANLCDPHKQKLD